MHGTEDVRKQAFIENICCLVIQIIEELLKFSTPNARLQVRLNSSKRLYYLNSSQVSVVFSLKKLIGDTIKIYLS